MINLVDTPYSQQIGCLGLAGGVIASTNINSSYIHKVSGTAVTTRYISRGTAPINEVYIFLDGFSGTLANITMQCTLYNSLTVANTTNVTIPGDTILATSTAIMPTSEDRWIRFVFNTPYTPATGEIIWFVFTNTSTSPTVDFPAIRTNTNGQFVSLASSLSYLTTNGNTTTATQLSEMCHVIRQGNKSYGLPITQFGQTFANNTVTRGMLIKPFNDCYISMIEFNGSANFDKIRIYEANQPPSSTPLFEGTLRLPGQQANSGAGGFIMPSPFKLTKNRQYIIAITMAGNTDFPGGFSISDYSSFPSIFDSFTDHIIFAPGVIQSGDSWSIIPNFYPRILLIISKTKNKTVVTIS